MTDRDEMIIDTIKRYTITLEQSKDKTTRLMNFAQLNGLIIGLDLALGKEKSQELHKFAMSLLSK